MNKLVATCATLAMLVGCAGTQASFNGNVCGQPVAFTITDRKDRGAFVADFTCPGGGSAHVESSDSSTSAVIQAQADALAKSAAALGQLAGAIK